MFGERNVFQASVLSLKADILLVDVFLGWMESNSVGSIIVVLGCLFLRMRKLRS